MMEYITFRYVFRWRKKKFAIKVRMRGKIIIEPAYIYCPYIPKFETVVVGQVDGKMSLDKMS